MLERTLSLIVPRRAVVIRVSVLLAEGHCPLAVGPLENRLLILGQHMWRTRLGLAPR
jgi:hypothetical protein